MEKIETVQEPEEIIYCTYCNRFVSLDDYDAKQLMCKECAEKLNLKQEDNK